MQNIKLILKALNIGDFTLYLKLIIILLKAINQMKYFPVPTYED
jgi:hypothetical protein